MDFTYCLPNEARTRFNWVCWDGEAVLYNSLSGDTHRVVAPSGHILTFVESDKSETFRSASVLLKSIQADCSTTLSEIEELLSVLCTIGLLKKTPIEDCRPLSYGTVSSPYR